MHVQPDVGQVLGILLRCRGRHQRPWPVRTAPNDRSECLAQPVLPADGVYYADHVLDTHAVARSLTAAEFTPAQADAITVALRSVVEQGDDVTSDQFKAGIAEARIEIAGLRHASLDPDRRLCGPSSGPRSRPSKHGWPRWTLA